MLFRQIKGSDVQLSQITFGSMRFDPARVDSGDAVELLNYAYDSALTTFHSSREYPFHDYFCQKIATARQASSSFKPSHIVKIAEPHYGVDQFSKTRFRNLIEEQIKALKAERLDVVQWQLRYSIEQEGMRQSILFDCRRDIEEEMESLRREGKVGAFMSDPYTVPFAEKVLELPAMSGLVTYLNLLEFDFVPLLEKMPAMERCCLALRPLAAGWLTPHGPRKEDENTRLGNRPRVDKVATLLGIDRNALIREAVQFPLMHPSVVSVIMSLSSRTHVDEALEFGARCAPNPSRFYEIVSKLHG